jgi:hypothetical protein
MTDDSTSKIITAWLGGTFKTVSSPNWWGAEQDRIWSGPDQTRASDLDSYTYGDDEGQHIETVKLTGDRGYAVEMWNVFGAHTVWCPTEADLLDFLTVRAPAWLRLGVATTGDEALSKIAETLIGYARHGAGEHIRTDGMVNDIDDRRRLAALRPPKKEQSPG